MIKNVEIQFWTTILSLRLILVKFKFRPIMLCEERKHFRLSGFWLMLNAGGHIEKRRRLLLCEIILLKHRLHSIPVADYFALYFQRESYKREIQAPGNICRRQESIYEWKLIL